MSVPGRAGKALLEALRSLFALPASPGPRTGVAIRAALSMGVPYVAMTLIGRPDLGLQAGAGAFISIFLAAGTAKERAIVLPFVGAALLCCGALGAVLAPSVLAFSLGLVAVTVVVGLFAFAFRLGPPGPVFFVLLYGLAANVTGVVGGERVNSPASFLLALAGGIAFSYGLAALPLILPSLRRAPSRALRELLPGPWLGRDEKELVTRIAIVAIVGTVVSVLFLDPHRAYWTVATGVAVVGLNSARNYSFVRGLHRTFGTLLGSAAYFVIAPLGQHRWALAVILPLLQFAIEHIVVRNYALALVFITPLVLFISGAAVPGIDIEAVALIRVIDTVIGTVIAMLTVPVHRKRSQL